MSVQFTTVVMNQNSQRYVWRTSANNIYVLYQDQDDFSGNPINMHMMKSSNNGTSFAEVDSAHHAAGAARPWSGVIDSNGLIHIVMGGNPATDAGYVTFNTSTDTWGTLASAFTLPAGVNANIAQMYIALDRNNKPHIGVSYSTLVASVSTGYLYYTNRISGSWSSGPTWNPNADKQQIFGDFLIDAKDNIPIFITNQDDGTGAFGQLVVHYGNANNASSFTVSTIATGLMFSSARISMVQDDLYNTYVGYFNKTSSFQCLRRHNAGDAWSTWGAEISEGIATTSNGSISLVAVGRNIYTLYTKTSTGVAKNMYNGVFWDAESIIESGSTNTQPLSRYSNINQFSPSTIDYAFKQTGEWFGQTTGTALFTAYFDASDAAATDPGSIWTNDAEAFNGDLTTGATATASSTSSSGYLMAEGTNAPVTSGPISQVEARVYGKGSSDGSGSYGSYTTLSAPSGGWTWQAVNDLEVKIDSNAGGSATLGVIHAGVYTNGLGALLGTATWTSGANVPQTLGVYRIEVRVTYVAYNTYTPSHGTSAVKKIIPTLTHNTDANKKRTNTRTHTTSSFKYKQITKAHTTDANRKVSGLTRSHSTDSNKKKAGVITSHTTDAMRHLLVTKTHTTDSNKRKPIAITHSTDSNKRKQLSVSHSTDSLVRKQNTRVHATDANKKLPNVTRTHTTDTLKRKTNTRSHTTNSYIQPSLGTLSTDYLDITLVPVIVVYTKPHTTDANKRKALSVAHSTDANKRKTFSSSHTTDANKRKTTPVSHTTDTLLRKQTTKTHTTDALKRKAITKTHSTDALKRQQFVKTHTTDSNKRKATLVSHTTDANKRKANIVISHTTDALKRKQFTKSHTTDSLKRTQNTRSHTTDSLKRKTTTRTHTTDALLRKQVTRVHTTDALKRAQLTRSHTTSANKRKSLTVFHTTDSNKRKTITRTHSTDSLLRRSRLVTHTTDALKRAIRTVSHTTSSFLRTQNARTHTTDALLRRARTLLHLTDAFKRKTNAVTHATDANKRRSGNIVSHTTSAILRKARTLSHTTSSQIRQLSTRSHSTDANKSKRLFVSHLTDSLLRRRRSLTHSTDANVNRAHQLSHNTDTVVSTQHSAQHRTDASIWNRRGTKKVLVNGVWHYGVVKVLINGQWVIVSVYYWNGTAWVLTEQ